MPNPSGGNQFGNFTLQPAYGDVAKQTELTREAPVSGAAVAGRALNAPRRGERQTMRGQPQPAQAPQQQPQAGAQQAAPPTPKISPQAWQAQSWQQIAAIPGASPLVQQYAARAQSGT